MKNIRLSLDDAMFAAVAYADIFEYALTDEEVRLWMPFRMSLKRPRLFRLKPQEKIVKVKAARAALCKEKWERAKKVSLLLRFIPTIELVGVTGGLAMNNADKNDDIDLFIIASRGTVWVTRLVATIIVEWLGCRRKPNDKEVGDKICLNMFLGDDVLSLSHNERDFFSAHEVLQMIPLWQRGPVYKKFLLANRWVKRFLPNAWDQKCQMIHDKWPIKKQEKQFGIWHLAFSILEPLARVIQLWYMKNRRTNEVISNSVIRFHPRDARVWIRLALAARLAKRKIPLDKIFYGR